MKMLLLLVLCVSLSAAARSTCLVSGELNKPMNLTSGSNPQIVRGVTWYIEINGTKTLFAKIENGITVGNLSNRYELFNNGNILGIKNLTRNDLGLYIVDVTYSDEDATMDEVKITITLPDDNKKMDPKTIIIIVMVLVVGLVACVVLWKCWKRSSNPTGQGDQKEDRQTHQNENVVKGHENREHENEEILPTPVQETQTPASSVTVILPDPSDKSPASSVTVILPHPSDKYSKFQASWHRDYVAVDRQSCDVPTEKETDEEATQHQQEQQEVVEMMPLMKITEATN